VIRSLWTWKPALPLTVRLVWSASLETNRIKCFENSATETDDLY